MSEPVIETMDLTKTYRLYAKPAYRFLDMFGLLSKNPAHYSEHKALDSVNLKVWPGEKVAIIGRNGAGKSTLLKVIMGVTEPTTGHAVVRSKIHALLQIGTGFHPEFTGRENVYSYLAQLGISGARACELFEEIVEFAELEEYIDQPIKTYSTGMGMRLMFATSTAIEPELLVLDEVLGVGDAYFAQKSFQRIQEMCVDRDTTLLLVTHDLYSAMKICDRFIWIDSGAMLMDDTAENVIKRYEASIRDQQEEKLRASRLRSLKENLSAKEPGKLSSIEPVFGQLRCEGNVPVDAPVPIEKLQFIAGGKEIVQITANTIAEDELAQTGLLCKEGEGNWGKQESIDNRRTASFRPDGSIFHRAPFVVIHEGFEELLKSGDIRIDISYKDLASTPCLIELFSEQGKVRYRAQLGNTGDGIWKITPLKLEPELGFEPGRSAFNRYGTQAFSINDVQFLGPDGNESHVFSIGDRVHFRMSYSINDPGFDESPVILLAFLKDGITRSHRFVIDAVRFDYKENESGVLEVVADPLLLAPGDYLINISVMKEGGYEGLEGKKFFTANENILDFHSRAYQIEVTQSPQQLANDVVFFHRACWIKDGTKVYEGIYPLEMQVESERLQ